MRWPGRGALLATVLTTIVPLARAGARQLIVKKPLASALRPAREQREVELRQSAAAVAEVAAAPVVAAGRALVGAAAAVAEAQAVAAGQRASWRRPRRTAGRRRRC